MSWEESFSKGWSSRFSTPMVKKTAGIEILYDKRVSN